MPDDKTTPDAPTSKQTKKNGNGPPKDAAPKAPARRLGLPNMKILQARLAQEKQRAAARAAKK